jgi:predicted lipoprotein with Yx(FWY)xxD motif
MQLETAPVNRTGPDATVLAVTMDHGFGGLNDGAFPVYTLKAGDDDEDEDSCQQFCAQYWPPVLTSGDPQAGPGVHKHALGTIRRHDGSRQVTYNGRPLYLFADDAYIPGLPYNGGAASISGAGANTLWGVFNTVPPLP